MRATLYASFIVCSSENDVPAPTSVPSDSSMPALSARSKSNRPLPRNRFDVGHTAAAEPVAAMRAMSSSSSQMQWPNIARGRIRP